MLFPGEITHLLIVAFPGAASRHVTDTLGLLMEC